MESLGKQGEAMGKVGGRQLAVLKAHPGHQASKLSLYTWVFATCDVCSINNRHSLPLTS